MAQALAKWGVAMAQGSEKSISRLGARSATWLSFPLSPLHSLGRGSARYAIRLYGECCPGRGGTTFRIRTDFGGIVTVVKPICTLTCIAS